MKGNPSWYYDIIAFIYETAGKYCLNQQDILLFLSTYLSSQMAKAKISDKSARKNLDKMFFNFQSLKEKLKKEANEQK